MLTATHTLPSFRANTLQTPKNSEEQVLLKRFSQGQNSAFWELWQQYRDYLYDRCLGWMSGNCTDAEDALSWAMLKAWEKVQKYAYKITNFKAWLTTLTYNLCVDIHREHNRGVNLVENIEIYALSEELELVLFEDTPQHTMDSHEERVVIRGAIDNLPYRLRETFILHYYEELSYLEIAQQQDISYQNVCKRISQARGILRLELKGYFIGDDEINIDLPVTPTLAATESVIEKMSPSNGVVSQCVGETATLSAAVEKVEIVIDESPQKVELLVQHSESVRVTALTDGKLEIETDGCQYVEVAPCENQPTLILALAQFEEARSWANSCLAVQRIQKKLAIGKRWGGFLLMSRSPPLYCLSYFQSFVKRAMILEAAFVGCK